jgi:hypothetical protein
VLQAYENAPGGAPAQAGGAQSTAVGALTRN